MALDVLCGQNGLVNQINDVQKQINQYIFLGKNAIAGIQATIAAVKNIANTLKKDPKAVLRTIQEDVIGIVSAEALKDPNSALAKMLEIKNAYEQAGPAVDSIIKNVEAFIKDPLNVSLDVCNDIPNLIKLGDAVVEAVNPAKVPAPDASPEDIRQVVAETHEQVATIQATIAEEELKNKKEQTIPTSGGAYAVPDVGEDRKLAGRTPPERVYDPKPGDAHAAAIYGATGERPVSSTNPTTGATVSSDSVSTTERPTTATRPVSTTSSDGVTTPTTAPVGQTVTATSRPITSGTTTTSSTTTTTASAPVAAPTAAPRASLANPYPGGKQYTAADFAPSKYATTIAQRINTLDPAVRGVFAAGIQDYIKNNFKDGRDVSVGEAYRSPERSAQLAAAYAAGTGGRAAGAGKSWHNYGAACDLCIYVNGVWDRGNKSESEYTGRARQSMAKYGLINDLKGDSGHFYIQALGAGVPKALQQGQTTLAALARSKGTALA